MPFSPIPPRSTLLNKVPAVTAGFWIIKVMSTTVGETAADYLMVEAGLGLAITAGIMGLLLLVCLFAEVRSTQYRPWLYWLCVVLVSIVGTQITDALTDGFGVSLYISTSVFTWLLGSTYAVWFLVEGTLSIKTIVSRRREFFYWLAVLCAFALGTAAGDLATEAIGLGFKLGTQVFAVLIVAVAIAWRLRIIPQTLSFWIVYVLTRPLGAALGDWLTQSHEYGGLGLGAMWTSALFLSVIVVLVAVAQRASGIEAHSFKPEQETP